MPLQNRVDPFGNLIRTSAKGSMMGNRGGVMHKNREIVRHYHTKRWITCVLDFKGQRRVVMTEGLYTELFFLDEATAFAAGHRPCAECRRERFNAFRDAWRQARFLERRPSAEEMDRELHPARIDRGKKKVTHEAEISSLPDGCFVEIEGRPCLVWGHWLLDWTPAGYEGRVQRPSGSMVTVLTPAPVVDCLRSGYRPAVHVSAGV